MKMSKRQIDLLGHVYFGRPASLRGNVVKTSSGRYMGPASVANALKRRGYVEYKRHMYKIVPADCWLLVITEEGRAAYDKVAPIK